MERNEVKHWIRWRGRKAVMRVNYLLCRMLSWETCKKINTALVYRRKLDLAAPRKLNEKILWIEYHTDPAVRSTLSDKFRVRDYVKSRGYGENLIPLLAVYGENDDIDLESLPRQFVMKAVHGSDMNYICRDKRNVNKGKICARSREWMRINLAYLSFERHYQTIRPGIIFEKYIGNGEADLTDYKFHCSDGRVRFILVCTGKAGNRWLNVFRTDWEPLHILTGAEESPEPVPKPENLERMIRMAEDLAAGHPFVRVDLYQTGEKIYFGEMTFTPAAGVLFHFTEDFLEKEGQYCTLPEGN